jgi:translation initiation factor 3 subunit C
MESSDEEPPAPVPTTKKTARFDLDATLAQDDQEGFSTVGKDGRALQYTPESIFKHLRGILESRGKKSTDRAEQIGVLVKLHEVAQTSYQKIRVLLTLISARFDAASGSSGAMSVEYWNAAEKELSALLTILEEDKEYVVVEGAEEWEDDEKPPTLQEGEKYIKVPGSVVSLIERLDDELNRSLQSIDPHTSDYIDRLKSEGSLYNIIFRGLLYYEYLQKDSSLETPQESLNRVVMRRLEHIYFKVRTVFHQNA